jgi:4-alpha-glucanotransferase
MLEVLLPYISTAVTGVVAWFAADYRRSKIDAKKAMADAESSEIDNAAKIVNMYITLLEKQEAKFREISEELAIVKVELLGCRNEIQVLRNHVIKLELENETLRKGSAPLKKVSQD